MNSRFSWLNDFVECRVKNREIRSREWIRSSTLIHNTRHSLPETIDCSTPINSPFVLRRRTIERRRNIVEFMPNGHISLIVSMPFLCAGIYDDDLISFDFTCTILIRFQPNFPGKTKTVFCVQRDTKTTQKKFTWTASLNFYASLSHVTCVFVERRSCFDQNRIKTESAAELLHVLLLFLR